MEPDAPTPEDLNDLHLVKAGLFGVFGVLLLAAFFYSGAPLAGIVGGLSTLFCGLEWREYWKNIIVLKRGKREWE